MSHEPSARVSARPGSLSTRPRAVTLSVLCSVIPSLPFLRGPFMFFLVPFDARASFLPGVLLLFLGAVLWLLLLHRVWRGGRVALIVFFVLAPVLVFVVAYGRISYGAAYPEFAAVATTAVFLITAVGFLLTPSARTWFRGGPRAA
jgi:hypothetical protein